MGEQEFSDAFERAVKVVSRANSLIEGVIESVDESTLTCTVTVGDSLSSVIYDNVYLDVLLTGQGSFICIPTVGSNCILLFRGSSEERRQLVKCFNYDKIIAAPVKWQFNDGSKGGVPMVNPLVEKINRIEDLLNDVISQYNLHTHPVIDTGAPTGPTSAPEAGNITPITKVDDLQNPAVTQ